MRQKNRKTVPAGRTLSVLLAVCCFFFGSCGAGETADAETEAKDYAAPIIKGVRSELRIPVGGEADLMEGVSAHDTVDGDVDVELDDSELRTDKPGHYQVRYTAKDRTGNTAEKTLAVTVSNWDGVPADPAAVDGMIGEIAGSILTDTMSERERAEAVFDWISAHIRYRADFETLEYMSEGIKTDDHATAAYFGLTKGYGACWTFYTVSELLLTRAGLENRLIRRATPSHYWNLVRVDGEWYHFDTTPSITDPDRRVFLLTDAELAEYNGEDGYYVFDPSLYPPRHED